MSPARTFADLGLTEGLILGPRPDPNAPVAGLAVDSRDVRKGFVFAALKGVARDGASFVGPALRQGACAIITGLDGAVRALGDATDFEAPVIIDRDPRRRLAETAARFYGAQPDCVVAVTGTNGKTSVASFTRQIWESAGTPGVSFGTMGVEGAGLDGPLAHTTPEPITLHRELARLAEGGATHLAMEASSHGLAQARLDGVRLTAGALTNLSRDHMDYHSDAADYLAAKLRLFADLLPVGAAAVLNADDPCWPAARIVAEARDLRITPVGRSDAAEAGLQITGQEFHAGGQTVVLKAYGVEHRIPLSLVGGFQAENAAVAAGLAMASGVDPETAISALAGLKGVRGRMQLAARRANGAPIYVDYSHTPASLQQALTALRPHVQGRLIVVFGAGGDRDAGKRPMMGAAAAKAADVVYVTDDNPRSEPPAAIRAAVIAGAPEATEIGDRAEAILSGADALGANDCLLIAGKGHETGQEIAGVVHPFDDIEQARAAVGALDGLDAVTGPEVAGL